MRVAQSPEFLQSVIDHPKVRPWIAPDGVDGELPLAAVFHEGIGLEFNTGGFFFHRLGDGVFEVHTLFLPGTRDAFECCQAAAHFMFCGTECTRIVTKVPADNVPAWKLTEKMEFRLDYVRPSAFLRGGKLHDVKHYSLVMDDWMRRQQSTRWVQEQCTQLGNEPKGLRAAYRWAVMNDELQKPERQGCQQLAPSLEQ
jgi:hypothetical protein